jgi:hypothetical protein
MNKIAETITEKNVKETEKIAATLIATEQLKNNYNCNIN